MAYVLRYLIKLFLPFKDKSVYFLLQPYYIGFLYIINLVLYTYKQNLFTRVEELRKRSTFLSLDTKNE